MLLGATVALLFLTLTSAKFQNSGNDLSISSIDNRVVVFNRQTKVLYTYPFNSGKLSEKSFSTYKIADDGSSTMKVDN